MKELIGSIISLLLLVPIMYFLPLGLSKKGKGILVLTAFIIANVGLLAKLNFAIWQTVLLILLLVILTVYIFDKRLGQMVYDKDVLLDNNEIESLDQSLSQTEEELVEKPKLKIMDLPIDQGLDPVHFVEDDTHNDINFENDNMQQDISSSLSIEEETFASKESPLDPLVDDEKLDENDQGLDTEIEEISLEDISFLNNREEMINDQIDGNDSIFDQQNEMELEKIDYMIEIENMLQNDDLENTQTKEENQLEESIFVEDVEIDYEIDSEKPSSNNETMFEHDNPNLYKEYIKQAAPAIENMEQNSDIELLQEDNQYKNTGDDEDLKSDNVMNHDKEVEYVNSNLYTEYVNQAATAIESTVSK